MMIAVLIMGREIRHGGPFVKARLMWESHPMNRKFVNQICAVLPGAELTDPWGGGHDAWKIGGKMFASIGVVDTGVSVKTPDIETAQLLIDVGRAEKAAYFHKSWVHLPWGAIKNDEMAERLRISYGIIRGGLTKKFLATLAPFDGQA